MRTARQAALEGKESRGPLYYLRYSFIHPLHLSCLGSLLLVTLVSGSVWGLLPVAALEGVLAGASRLPVMRRFIERRRRAQRRDRASQLRAALAVHMDPRHHGELRELEERAATARAHAASVGESMEALLDDGIGVDRLLGTFVRLSIAHRVARESLAMTDREQLADRVRELEHYRERTGSRRLRELTERELALLRRRLGCLEGNEEEVAAISRDLSAVAAACRLVHERALSMVHPGDGPEEVERLVAQAQIHDEALGELTPGDAQDVPVTPQVPEQQRGEPAARSVVVRAETHDPVSEDSDDAESVEDATGTARRVRVG